MGSNDPLVFIGHPSEHIYEKRVGVDLFQRCSIDFIFGGSKMDPPRTVGLDGPPGRVS